MDQLTLKNFFKSSAIGLSLDDLIQSPVNNLIGVSDGAKEALSGIGVKSVFDLAYSEIFKVAAYISQIDGTSSFLDVVKQIPSDYLDKNITSSDQGNLKNLDIKALKGIGNQNGRRIKEALSISTIRELAFWPPYLNAKAIIDRHFGLGQIGLADLETPQDLVPKTGGYPVEIVYYNSTVLINAPGLDKKKEQKLEAAGKVKFNFDEEDKGFISPGFGAHITFSQSWYVQGITLGSLLKAVPLAAGESTKIAVVDWQRQSIGNTAENISQTERLSNTLSQTRAVNEIAQATAKELQNGSSTLNSNSEVESESSGGWQFHLFMGGGGQESEGETTVNSTVITTSDGQRDLSSKMVQNINSRTQQNSFSSRNKRASIITEVSERDSETITTRTISNYNHMHALTIQYWQMVQIYRTEVQVASYKRCLFIPMEVFDFSDQRVITRFRAILIRFALNNIVRELLMSASNKVMAQLQAIPFYESIVIPPNADKPTRRSLAIDIAKLKAREKITFEVLHNKGLLDNFNQEESSWAMNGDFSLLNVKWEIVTGTTLKEIRIILVDGQTIKVKTNGTGFSTNTLNPDINSNIPISRIDSIKAEFTPGQTDSKQTISFRFKLYGNTYETLPIVIFLAKDKSVVSLLEFTQALQLNDLSDLLNLQALYYSQKIWLHTDPQFLTLQLSSFTFQGKPVVESIDPKPVSVFGNCLGFIWHDQDDKKWQEWVKDNINTAEITTQRIAIPTDGVFAEAVLGRFNCAEKLDLTRFWNWQDSPIPISAPDIAAIQAGNHQNTAAPQPGSLDSPIINVMNPPALPDPTGMQGILQALATANLFRDMSGISQASSVAGAAINSATQGSIAVGEQVGNNLSKQLDLSKSLIGLLPMLAGLPPIATPASKNITTAGAAFNAAQGLDNSKPATVDNASTQSTRGTSSTSPSSLGPTLNPNPINSRGETGAVMDMLTGKSPNLTEVPNNESSPRPQNITNHTPVLYTVESNKSTDFSEVSFFLFDYAVDKWELTATQKEKLDSFVENYLVELDFGTPSSPVVITEIIGRASEPGRNAYNLELGRKRGYEVMAHLLSKGISNTSLPRPTSDGEENLMVQSFGAENEVNRHVEIRYSIFHEKVKVMTPSTAQGASKKWNLDMQMNVSGGHIGIGGSLSFGFLTNRTTQEKKQVQIWVGGLDGSLGFPVGADITISSTQSGDFELKEAVTFDFFDAIPITMGGTTAGALFGVSSGFIAIGIPAVAFLPTGSIDLAIKLSMGGNYMMGLLNVN